MKKVVFVVIVLMISMITIPTVYSEQVSDETDQQQTTYNASTCLLGSMLFAQSFTPEVQTLTKVALYMNKFGGLYGNSILSIRESLTSGDLTSISKESVEIDKDMGWVEFNFDDIEVTPGESYYIILKPDPDSDGGEVNYITWAFGWEDYYPNGAPYTKYQGEWSDGVPSHSSADFTFKTYGFDKDNKEVEITISAGNFKQDIGLGVSIGVLNYKTESITIEYSVTRDRYFANEFPETFSNNFTVSAEDSSVNKIGVGNTFVIYNINISAWIGGYKVERQGISIGELVILN